MAESGYTRPEGSKLKTYFNNIVYGLGIVALGGGIWTAGNGAMSWNSRPLKHDITIRSSSGSYNNADIDFKLFYYWLATLRLKSNPSIVLQQKPEKGLILRPETEFQGLKTLDYVCKQEGILSKDDIVIYYEKDSDGNIALRTRVIPSDLEKAIFPEGEEAISQLLCDYRPSLPPQTMSSVFNP